MVGTFGNIVSGLLAQAAEPAASGVDPSVKVRLFAALVGLVILGFGLVLLAWLGGRATRRYMASGHSLTTSSKLPSDDDWAKKPLDSD